jgi:alpha-D-xyloside xylohydrolase
MDYIPIGSSFIINLKFISIMFRNFLVKGVFCLAIFACSIITEVFAQNSSYSKINNGVRVHSNASGAKIVEVSFVNDKIVHVLASPLNEIKEAESLTVNYTKIPVDFKQEVKADTLVLTSKAVVVKISLKNGEVKFSDLNGKTYTEEKGRKFDKFSFDGEPSYDLKQYFSSEKNEVYYGLGQHQQDFVDHKGRHVELLQYNTEIAIPLFISSKNYGVYWDNSSLNYAGDIRKAQELYGLKLYSDKGETGWLTAKYAQLTDRNNIVIERPESEITYGSLDDQYKFPKDFPLEKAVVTWTGSIESLESGNHQLIGKFGGAVKVWLDNKLIADKWRKAWNPLTFVLDLDLQEGKKYPIKIEWVPEGNESYIDFKTISPDKFSQEETFAFHAEAGDAINYYFIAGNNADEIISGYRTLTGKAVMMPKWAMGFWQSRERYKTQDELLEVVREFRKRKMPIDNIVLDWSFWEENAWGSQDFDLIRFPNANAMIQEVHKNNMKIMISVWPKIYKGIDVYNKFDEKGFLYKRNIAEDRKDWIGKGYSSTFYDPFNPEARSAFWNLINDKLYKKGIDAWWLDATEPDMHSNLSMQKRKEFMNPTFLGSSVKYFNAFPLVNAKGVYEGQRSVNPNERVFILTRSAFAGLQRYAAAAWSGDIGSRWEDMKAQISAGISFSLSGLPYWTMDIGGFVVERRFENPTAESTEEWREMQSRWYQFGAFTPLFRAHGQYPFREFYNIAPENHVAYKSMVYYNQLRYRLMPYIYSLNGQIYHQDYSMMRGLVMDFGNDEKALRINDSYMFGPSLLINPVYKYKETSREVYLPNGQGWYDLYTGKYQKGGQNIIAEAPYEKMPIYVKEGSILPIGPAIQYTSEKSAEPIILYVYGGKDATFTLYEDEGTNYNYEKGAYSNIQINYQENLKKLTIEDRKGSFTGMIKNRTFQIVFINHDNEKSLDFSRKGDQTIKYSGKKVTINL